MFKFSTLSLIISIIIALNMSLLFADSGIDLRVLRRQRRSEEMSRQHYNYDNYPRKEPLRKYVRHLQELGLTKKNARHLSRI